jgi:hypothetical protein
MLSACTFRPNVDFSLLSLNHFLMHSYELLALQFIHLRLNTFIFGGDIPMSVLILHMLPCIEHRYVPCTLELVLFPATLVSSIVL